MRSTASLAWQGQSKVEDSTSLTLRNDALTRRNDAADTLQHSGKVSNYTIACTVEPLLKDSLN